jgi:hypothetical protein
MLTQIAVSEAGLVWSDRPQPIALDQLAGCRAEVPCALLDEQGKLLDSLIDFAFDVLGACYLDVRVVPSREAYEHPIRSGCAQERL